MGLKKRQQAQQEESIAKGHTSFVHVSTMGKLEDDFRIQYIVARSDLTSQDLMNALERDPDSLSQCMTFLTQLGQHLPLPKTCKVISVTTNVLGSREAALDSAMARFKSSGGLMGTGLLDWSKGCYQPVFQPPEAEFMTHIKHRPSGETVPAPEHVKLVKGFDLVDNWDDFAAAFRRHPFPDIPVVEFFRSLEKKAKGPFKVKRFAGPNSAKEFAAVVKLEYEKFVAEQERLEKQGGTAEVNDMIKKHQKANKEAALVTARAKAKAQLVARKGLRSIKIA